MHVDNHVPYLTSIPRASLVSPSNHRDGLPQRACLDDIQRTQLSIREYSRDISVISSETFVHDKVYYIPIKVLWILQRRLLRYLPDYRIEGSGTCTS